MNDTIHRFLAYKEERPQISQVNKIATSVLNLMFNSNLSTSKYRKSQKLSVNWLHPKKGMQTGTLRYADIVDHILANRALDSEALCVPDPTWNWLDNTNLILAADMSPMRDETGTLTFCLETNFGETFPFKPKIDREGIACASFQIPLQQNILQLHRLLVDNSHL